MQASPLMQPSLVARFTAEANLLFTANPDAANMSFNALKVIAEQGISVGPILLGAAKPIHVLKPTTMMRSVVKMTASRRVAAA
jgi:malate dehydrogenase (oxaloacetate-decarboxylating)(NADP+)